MKVFEFTASIVFGILIMSGTAWAEEIAGKVGDSASLSIQFANAPVIAAPAASISVIPGSPTNVSNCIPFGINVVFGFTGFIYRDVPSFDMPAGATIRFDLGDLNDRPIQRNIFFGTANINPAPGVLNTNNVVSQGVTVDANGWTQVVQETQVPLNPLGNNISGDYELTYTADAPFSFPGGGLLIGFQSAPPAVEVDVSCEEVLVTTDTNDANPSFYARFFNKQDLSLGVLDSGPGGTGVELGGFILEDLAILVDIDIKFCSDPNAFNCKKKGVLPVTIFGTDTFHVADIDPSSLQLCLEDLSVCTDGPRNWSFADRGDPSSDLGASMCAIDPLTGLELDYLHPDGFDDMDAAFEASEVQDMLADFCGMEKNAVSDALIITGSTFGGTLILSAPVNNTGIDQLWKVNKNK